MPPTNHSADLAQAITEMNAGFTAFRTDYDRRAQLLDDRLAQVENVLARPGGHRAGPGAPSNPNALRELNAGLRKWIRHNDPTGFQNAMSIDSDADGGYAVVPEFSRMVYQVMREVNTLRQYARVVPVSTLEYEELVDAAGTTNAAWVGETAARPATDVSGLKKHKIPTFELYSQPEATQNLIDDASVDIVSWLGQKIGEDFAIAEAAAAVVGDGLGKPRGFATFPTEATADGSRAWGKFQHVVSGANGAFAGSGPGDCLIDLSHSIKPQYKANARWFMNRTVLASVRKLKDSNGDYLMRPGLEAGHADTLLGYPVVTLEDLPVLATNSLSIWFGDMARAVTIVNRQDMRMLLDPYTNKPHVRFYSTARVGAGVMDFHALKALKFSAS